MEKLIHISDDNVKMEGMLNIPPHAATLVIFVHGSGSGRFSPRNNFVAKILNNEGLGTLLIDLLSKEEDAIYETRFDINLLTKRLNQIIHWLEDQPDTKHLHFALFGASTGAAAALRAAAFNHKIQAVVSRGGRPDMVIYALHKVTAPTLFIVGENDSGVIDLNREAFEKLTCPKEFKIIPHATHLFEEPGCLEEVAHLSAQWFLKYSTALKK